MQSANGECGNVDPPESERRRIEYRNNRRPNNARMSDRNDVAGEVLQRT
jgi:hypothetical protein